VNGQPAMDRCAAYFGNLSLVKGIGDLLEAAAMLLDRGASFCDAGARLVTVHRCRAR
jgi:hypothetical protein